MLGAIAGDVIGSVHEQARTKTKDFPLFVPKSTFTDDTVLTVAVAESLLGRATTWIRCTTTFMRIRVLATAARFIAGVQTRAESLTTAGNQGSDLPRSPNTSDQGERGA